MNRYVTISVKADVRDRLSSWGERYGFSKMNELMGAMSLWLSGMEDETAQGFARDMRAVWWSMRRRDGKENEHGE